MLNTKSLSLVVLLSLMSVIFIYALPHLRVDRVSENCYLGGPYRMVAQGHPWVANQDPFIENGPQAIYLSTYIAYYFHSLKPMRYFHFLYSLLIMSLMYFLLLRQWDPKSLSVEDVAILTLGMISIWVTIPLSLVYPIQVNGMTPGFACFLMGLIWNKKHPYGAMLLFGLAYAYKGQFLAMMPGIMLYKLIFEKGGLSWASHLKRLFISLLLFFVPGTVILPIVFWLLGLFSSFADLKSYAFRAQEILFYEVTYIIPLLLHQVKSDGQGAAIRAMEYRGFGFVAWLLIAISILFCLGSVSRALYLKARGKESEINVPLTLFGMAGFFYWLNYLFFWRFPFWYNVLPVVLFNIFIIPYLIYTLKDEVRKRYGIKAARILFLCAALFFARNLYRRIFIKPTWDKTAMGDSLEPYEWMAKS